MQLVIAVVLFVASDAMRLLPDRLAFKPEVSKGLIPMIGLNIVGLRYLRHTPTNMCSDFPPAASVTIL